jgi:hypothetical protein
MGMIYEYDAADQAVLFPQPEPQPEPSCIYGTPYCYNSFDHAVCEPDIAQAHFERRKTGADAQEGEVWPWPVKPHVFVPWPNHVACAWCCGAVSNKRWHIKEVKE